MTVAHWNISRVPTLALGKGFESGDTPPEKGPDPADGSTVRNVPLPSCKFVTIVCYATLHTHTHTHTLPTRLPLNI